MKKCSVLVILLLASGCSAPQNPFAPVKRASRKSVKKLKNILPGFGSSNKTPNAIPVVRNASGSDFRSDDSISRVSKIIGPVLPGSSEGNSTGRPIYTTSDMISAGNYQHILLGKSPHRVRQKELKKLSSMEQTPAEARRALEIVAKTPGDPLSHLGLNCVAKFNDAEAQKLVIASLGDPRTPMRHEALSQVIRHKYSGLYDICLRKLRSDRNPAIRALACLGLGISGDKRAADFLRLTTSRDRPQVRIAAAWGLFLLDDPYGRSFLEQVVVADEPHLSLLAIDLVANIPDMRSINALVQALGGNNPNIWKHSFARLLETSAPVPQGAFDIPTPTVNMGAAFNVRFSRIRRRAALLAIARKDFAEPEIEKKRYALLNEIASQGSFEEKKLMAAVMFESGTERGIEPLLRCLEDDKREVVALSFKALKRIAQGNFSQPPLGTDSAAWRVWWIENCRSRIVRDSHSRRVVIVIHSPDGMNYFAAKGAAIVPGVIINDSAPEGKKARVTLEFRGKLYKIKSE